MDLLLTAFGIVFAITWLWLLVDCVRRREFGGPVGGRSGDKVFWVLTFVLFDPLLLGLYLLFVRLRWAWEAAWRPAIFVGALGAVLVVRAGPFGEVERVRVVAERGPDGAMDEGALAAAARASWGAGIQARVHRASTSSGTGSYGGVGLRVRWIRVQLLEDAPALRAAALELGLALGDLPFVDRVECVLDDLVVLDEGPGPDLTVLLDLESDVDLDLLVGGYFAGRLSMAACPTPWADDTEIARGDDRTEVGKVELSGSMRIDGWRAGFAVGTARHEAVSAPMAEWLRQTVVAKLEELADRDGVLPAAPASWVGAYRPPADVPRIADSLGGALVHASSGFLCDAHLAWTVDFGDDLEAGLERLEAQLEAAGFRAWRREAEGTKPILEARRDGERVRTRVHVTWARFPYRPFVPRSDPGYTQFPSRYVITAFDDFSVARLGELAADVLADDGPLALVLAVGDQLPAGAPRERLLVRVDELRETALLREAAGVARDAGRTGLAVELVRRGHEVARIRGEDDVLLESLAEDLGVELADANDPLDPGLLAELGFETAELGEEVVRPLRAGGPIEVVFGVEEPVLARVELREATVEYAFRRLDGGGVSGERSVAELRSDQMYRPIGYRDADFELRLSGAGEERRVHLRVTRPR